MVFKKTVAIDLGTDNTQIYLKGVGIVVDEPTMVAFNNKTNRVVAHGNQAKKMFSRTPSHITAIRPISHGAIADFDMAKDLLIRFLKRDNLPWSLFTMVFVTVPTSLTEVERKAVEDLFKEAGANPVYLIEQPLAAALGSRLDINQPTAYFIIDIGAGTTEMAVISMNGIVVSKRLKVAGEYLNNEIIRAVREDLKLDIGQPTAEEIKIAVGSAHPVGERLEINVRGRDVQSGLPREINIRDTQVRFWLSRPIKLITEAAQELIEITPAELVGDIWKNGIYLCGGSSLLRGIEQVVEKEIGVAVRVVEDPLTCVVRGAALISENINNYKSVVSRFSSADFLK